MSLQNCALFKIILKSCFSNLPKPDMQTRKSSEKEHNKSSGNTSSKTLNKETDFEFALVNKALELKLIPHKPWITKCLQLYILSQVYAGLCCVPYCYTCFYCFFILWFSLFCEESLHLHFPKERSAAIV